MLGTDLGVLYEVQVSSPDSDRCVPTAQEERKESVNHSHRRYKGHDKMAIRVSYDNKDEQVSCVLGDRNEKVPQKPREKIVGTRYPYCSLMSCL